jgi:hypothetical protein
MRSPRKIALLSLLVAACTRPAPAPLHVEPLTVVDAPDAAAPAGVDAVVDAGPAASGTAGGLWVVDALGAPIGVLVQRGHPAVAGTGSSQVDLLRDGVLVYAPKPGVFFGLQMSTGKVLAPRLGLKDTSCSEPAVAGYYTDDTFVSGKGYAFVFAKKWWKIKDYTQLSLVSCGGTVQDGADGVCQVHSGSCRGFPVQKLDTSLPVQFAGPLGFAWQ